MVADLDVFFIKAMIGPRGANSNHGGVQESNVYSTGKTVTSEFNYQLVTLSSQSVKYVLRGKWRNKPQDLSRFEHDN